MAPLGAFLWVREQLVSLGETIMPNSPGSQLLSPERSTVEEKGIMKENFSKEAAMKQPHIMTTTPEQTRRQFLESLSRNNFWRLTHTL